MRLRISLGYGLAQVLYARVKATPVVGDVIRVVDKTTRGAKPFPVRVKEIVTHIGGGDIFRVERVGEA